MKLLILIFGLYLAACQATKYREPVDLSQKEIMNMNLVDHRTNVKTHLQAGKIMYCKPGEADDACTIVICKDNASLSSGYECQMFEPASQTQSAGTTEYKNDFVQKMVETKVADYNEGRERSLIDFCKKNNVVCYLDRKFYPSDKEIYSKPFIRTVYKNTYKIKSRESHDIEITVYEI